MPNAAAPVTIGLPVFNGAQFLEASLDSLLSQTFSSFELIISDNASTDQTEDICRDYAHRDRRVRYIRQECNRGGVWNFNAVAREARSEYFKFHAYDDLCAPTSLEVCRAALTDNPQAAISFSRALEINAEGEILGEFANDPELRHETPNERLLAFLLEHRSANSLFGLIRREVLASVRPMGAFPSSDMVLLAELALRGSFVRDDGLLFFRRIHQANAVIGRSAEEADQWFAPRQGRVHSLRRTKMLSNLIAGIRAAPLPSADRARCLTALGRAWLPRYGRQTLGELRREAGFQLRRGTTRTR